MSNLTILHRIRQVKGSARQACHASTLRDLDAELGGMALSHPYRLIRSKVIDQMKPLLGVSNFDPGAAGPSANPRQEYIYHLTSVSKVLKYTHWYSTPPGFTTRRHKPSNLFRHLAEIYEAAERARRSPKDPEPWLPFKNYASGTYSGFRGFTWWTNLKLTPTHVVCGGHNLGLPNRWIPKYALIMRCPADYVNGGKLARVPTVLDGFISEIFSPADFGTVLPPSCGRTIDLESHGPLQQGPEEYALRPIKVEEIEFQPVLIDRARRNVHVIKLDVRMWQLLEIYYSKL
jgi:hypothetical protein